ncbi:hypothetical protein DICVIV_06049 [Dictyocaulus viviparus]|uniref:Uncharacterized protein n=1 Tax=Dictyocaulus viviparus TaxID=29172 RepID=A0A0D8XVP8_DICVI|nr:hypothetical protein DICVIV_06049 [Dictyocaulus viviparus]
MTDSLAIQPPNEQFIGRHKRVMRHVMVDKVGSKQRKGTLVGSKAKKPSSLESSRRSLPHSKGQLCLNLPNVVQTGIPMMMKFNYQGDITKVNTQDSAEFNSLRQMKPIGSPRSYVSSKSKSIRRKKVE